MVLLRRALLPRRDRLEGGEARWHDATLVVAALMCSGWFKELVRSHHDFSVH
jgi:hypothetical protein